MHVGIIGVFEEPTRWPNGIFFNYQMVKLDIFSFYKQDQNL